MNESRHPRVEFYAFYVMRLIWTADTLLVRTVQAKPRD